LLRHRILIAVVAASVAAGVLGTAGVGHAQTDTFEKVVKIGVLAPLDAGLVEFGTGIRNSVQVAVDQANKLDAIPGWTIEVLAVNDSSDAPTGAAGAATLAADPAVIGVVGTYNSGVALEAVPVLAAVDLAIISPSNTLAGLTLGDDPANPVRPNDNYFRMVASDAEQAPFLARSALDLGYENVAIVSETKAVSKGLADAFGEALTEEGGTIVAQEIVPDGATDFTGFLEVALPKKPDMIFFGGEYPVAAALRQQATDEGYKGPIMGGDGIKDDAYIEDAGAAAKGTLASTVGVPAAELKSAKAFLKAYKKAGFSEPPTDYGPYAFDAANVLIAAAKGVLDGHDAISAEARSEVVAAVLDTKTKGATGPISFDEFGDTTNAVFTLYRVQGKKTLAWVPFSP